MLSKVASQFPLIWLTCIGLLIFMSVFLGVLAWVFRKGSHEFYQALAMSALGIENPNANPKQLQS
jgi:cbb3-type cytochrome oxidase subunit 3